ncbi:response regulator transcription factor [Paenibacillus sp. J31TS4]|uniref:response regulator transcription factor n=1 Tax=Paenibacillus sp. J31TS4 TaxID=2807195 RepID=UPI0020BF062D|nr:response regulator transcription factor [Paenibacillus sp. J31TS4]
MRKLRIAMKPTILLVDDDKNILHLVNKQLKQAGYAALEAASGEEALRLLDAQPVDLAVVDVMMPGMTGYDLTRRIRENYDIPVILLTAKGEIRDKEAGFLAGSDDYVVKPFDPRELLFRIHAVFRRYQKQSQQPIRIGDVVIHPAGFEVQVNNQTLMLPLKEFELLVCLASRPGHVFTRSQLIESVWGMDYMGDERTLNVHIKRLRDRFSELTDSLAIRTVRGVGYLVEAAGS